MGSVVKKIISGFTVMIVTLSAIIVMLLIRTYMYNNEYESVLQNVLNLNTIKVKSANAAGDITNACIKNENIEESEILSSTEDMLTFLDELDESIGDSVEYQGNKSMVNSLRQLLVIYKEQIDRIILLGDGTNFPALDSGVNDVITSIRTMSADMSSYCNNNMTMELERSAVIQEEIEASFSKTIFITLSVFIIVLLICIVVCILIVKSIIHPINILKREIALVAEGDLTRDEIKLPSKDEFSNLAVAFNMMSSNLKEIIGKVLNVTGEIMNATEVAESTAQNNMQSSVAIMHSAGDINKRMHGQSNEIETIMKQMKLMEEISIRISEDVEKINSSTKVSKSKAEEGNESIATFIEQLHQVNDSVSKIAESADKFGSNSEEMNHILSGISDISQQTKLLSLNASIEAARAGDAGRGFSVVAVEINNLAEKTVELVAAISNIIEELRLSMKDMTVKLGLGLTQLEEGNTMVAQTQSKFVEILTDANQTSEDIQSIHQMVAELSGNVANVSDSMVAVSDVTEENTEMTDNIVKIVDNQTDNQKMLSDKVQILEALTNTLGSATSKFRIGNDAIDKQ